MTNIKTTIAIIGATTEGIKAAKQLSQYNNDVLLISTKFPVTRSKKVPSYQQLSATVKLLDYRYGLIYISLANGTVVLAHKVIIATGTKPKMKEPIKNYNSGIYYSVEALEKGDKTDQLVIYGTDEQIIKAAKTCSKKFRYVYVCYDALIEDTKFDMIREIKNVAILPNSNITDYIYSNVDPTVLKAVTLSTYDTVNCGYTLLFSGKRLPDISVGLRRLIATDKDGYAITKADASSTLVPNVYCIGACSADYSNAKFEKLISTIKEEK